MMMILDTKIVRPLRRIAFACAIELSVAPAASAQGLTIGIGDQIEGFITGIPSLNLTAEVLEDGNVNLAWLGDFPADGRSIGQLEARIRTDVEGLIVKQYDRDGQQFLVQLEASDLNIIRTAQKPIVVAGTVTNPGAVPFTPNMTVRDAIALAGGIDDRLLPDDVEVDALQIARWQADFGQAAIEHAEATILSWRLGAEIVGELEPILPMDTLSAVSIETVDEIRSAQLRLPDDNLAACLSNEVYFSQAVTLAEQRLEILRKQQATMTQALAAEEAEEARIVDLVERGLAPGSRESDVRRTPVLTATRLLDIEDDLARTEIDLGRTTRQFEVFEENRIEALLNAQVQADERVREARLRMDVVGQFLALTGTEVTTADVTSEFGVTTVLFRRSNGDVRQLIADMDTTLLPGDTLEADFEELIPAPLTE